MSKPRDGFVSRFFNRPISRSITRFLIKFPVHPDVWTLSIFVLPIGLIKLLYYRFTLRIARMVALGVVEKYRRAGVAEALVLRELEDGVKTGETSMTLEDNFMVNRFIEAVGARRYKTYRIYRRPIDERAP